MKFIIKREHVTVKTIRKKTKQSLENMFNQKQNLPENIGTLLKHVVQMK